MHTSPRRTAVAPFVGLLLVLGACGGGDGDVTAPTGNCSVIRPTGTMTATVDGQPFTATLSTIATAQNGTALGPNILQVSGVDCPVNNVSRQILITIGRLTPITPGTYPLDPASQSQPPGSGYSGIGQYVRAPNLWYSNITNGGNAGSGTITFTTISATRLTGSFQLVTVGAASNAAGTPARVTVTNGSFDIPVP